MTDCINFMKEAIRQARNCDIDVPVGCVIVQDGKIIATGHNTREKEHSITGHAEINAIRAACEKLSAWQLTDCDMYVTLEPCPMCAGAIKAARIRNVYFGSFNKTDGAAMSVYNILYPETCVYGGILEEECTAILTDFFKNLRV